MLRIHDIFGWIRIRGYMRLTNGSGFGSGSCYFRHWPSKCQQKTNFLTQFFSAFYFLKVHLHHFSNIKSQKESQYSRNQGFSYYFCMMIEGSGSGSWRPKNMWIRRIRIRIRNTAFEPSRLVSFWWIWICTSIFVFVYWFILFICKSFLFSFYPGILSVGIGDTFASLAGEQIFQIFIVHVLVNFSVNF